MTDVASSDNIDTSVVCPGCGAVIPAVVKVTAQLRDGALRNRFVYANAKLVREHACGVL